MRSYYDYQGIVYDILKKYIPQLKEDDSNQLVDAIVRQSKDYLENVLDRRHD